MASAARGRSRSPSRRQIPSVDSFVQIVIDNPDVFGYKDTDFVKRPARFSENRTASLGSILPYERSRNSKQQDVLKFQRIGATGFARISSEADGNCFLWSFLWLTSSLFREYDIGSMKKIARAVRHYLLRKKRRDQIEAVGRELFRDQIQNTGGLNITEEAYLDVEKNGTPGRDGPVEVDVMFGVIVGKFFGYNVIPLTITRGGSFKFDEVEQQVSFKTPGEDVLFINFHHGPPGHFEPIVYLNSDEVDTTTEFSFRWSDEKLDTIKAVHNSGAVPARRWAGGTRRIRRTRRGSRKTYSRYH